ncbi:putative sterigmatocystin biosynthesis peroxidase stcC 8 [Colletotrichum chlorophyti]|uniref:Putative sterigmatocystin biosynthesis peroxidase stcC 8 n=1 Tax=Colletotrichum chlorophyti TaxID=708187 RepID=A0A1Q8RQG9_9PEZI|nr:putative sterigmatocystin biosynthesis peroxidase stcC 8 [Colletotrichum chlorophyti]
MKSSIACAALAFSLVSANPALINAHLANPNFRQASPDQWAPPGPNDFRGPCPMMNTLANHGFLPHDGRNLTQENVVKGLQDGLNFNTSLGVLMFQMAIVANPEPNATFFTLDHLNVHNVLEHDASLSRTDAFFGNNHVFNQTIFDETRVYWTKDILDADQLANSKVARQISSKAFNPNYTFTATTENFSLGEVAAPIIAFGDIDAGTVNRTLVEYFFQNERLPAELGWVKKEAQITQDDILKVVEMISKASSLITESDSESETAQKSMVRDLHSGFSLLARLQK